MNNTAKKDVSAVSIFELTQEEFRERLKPTAEAIRKETFAKGGYLTYFDRLVCPTSAHSIHEYSDRKQLMRMDDNFNSHFMGLL